MPPAVIGRWSAIPRKSSRLWLWVLAFARTTTNKKRPGFAGAFSQLSSASQISGGGFLSRALDGVGAGRARCDRNVAGLLGLRNLAHEIDMQQAILE